MNTFQKKFQHFKNYKRLSFKSILKILFLIIKCCTMFETFIFAFLLLTKTVRTVDSKNNEPTVITLSKDNFTNAIKTNENIFINFYAPWCGHSKVLTPKFQQASEKMANFNPPIKFAKIDATENDELAYEQQVRFYPTLKFYRNSVATQYNGGAEASDIIEWLKKELQPPIKQLQSTEEVTRFLKENPIAIIGFFSEKDENTENVCVFSTVAANMKDFAFGMTNKDSVIADFNLTKESIVLFKPYDEQRMVFSGENDIDMLKCFIQLNSLPLIIEFEHSTASKILRGPTKAFLLFFLSDDEENQLNKYVEPLRSIAKSYRDYVLFVTVTYDNLDKRRVFEHFGITKRETPTILLIGIDENEQLLKYKPKSKEITIKTVDDFIQSYIEGCLEHYYLSQTLPDDWDEHPVKVLVATNFYDIALDEERTVLVEFYAPWCGLCKQLEPILQKLAEMYSDNDEIVIAKINGVSNEVENLKVTAFPTIKLFLKRTNKMISYNGVRTLEGLDEFLKENGARRITHNDL